MSVMHPRPWILPLAIAAVLWLPAGCQPDKTPEVSGARGGLIASAVAQEGIEQAKVVYHADFADPRRFSAMLTSINNMVTHYKNELLDYDVRIVFVAHGIRFVTDDPLSETPFAETPDYAQRRADLRGRLLSLQQVHGVKLELCDITRSEIDLPEQALFEGVQLVHSGVVRLAELQRQGFAYIKVE